MLIGGMQENQKILML